MHCVNCGAYIPNIRETSACPGCGENPLELSPEKTFSKEELKGKKIFAKINKAA